MKYDFLIASFNDRIINRSGILLFSPKDAMEFIKICKMYGYTILGIDGFYLFGPETEPSLENSVSFDSIFVEDACYENALRFISDRSDHNLYFELVVKQNV